MKKMKWWQKTLLITGASLGGIVATVMTVLLTLNIIKFPIYSDYYSIREIVCTNHGLNDNYVSQGTAVTDDGKYVITSGYMSDHTNSRIYITEIATDKTHSVQLEKPSGKAATYHFGGVDVNGDNIYLASDDSVFTVSLSEALSASKLQLKQFIEVHNQASYVFSNDKYIYVGEFYDGKQYKTNNSITYNDVTYNAIIEKFDLETKERQAVYAIRNTVQGFAIDEEGGMLLSTSFGLTSSNFYYYKTENQIMTNETYLDSPLYVLENHNFTLKGPAMSEDLDFYNGKFYTNYESSCNKYIFGKFFISSNKIVALDIQKLVK